MPIDPGPAGARASELLRRHPYHTMLGALVAGLLLSAASFELLMAAAGLAAALLSLARAPRVALAAAALTLAGGAAGAARLAGEDGPSLDGGGATRLEARAELLERPRPTRFGSKAAIKIVSGDRSGERLLAWAGQELRWPVGGEPGTELLVAGSVRRPRPARNARFDYPAYLRRRGIFAELALGHVRSTGRRRGGLLGAVDAMRRRAERALALRLSPPEAALVRGMVLGQDEAIEQTVRDDFRRSGLAHLLAVSGQNVMLLGSLALPVLAAAGLGLRARIAALLGLIALYVPLAGAGPSLQRAGVMGAAGLVALAAGRPASRWYALLLAAAVTLALNPRVAGDPGWQLSFAAVAGILAMGPALRRPLAELPRPVADGLAITLAATVSTAPLLAHHFGALSVAGLPANLLALPVVAPIMWIGMLQTGVAQAPALAAPLAGAADTASSALGRLNEPLLGYLAALAGWFADIPQAELGLRLASPLAVAGAYAAILAAALGAWRLGRKLEPAASSRAAAFRRLPRPQRLAWVASVLAAGALALSELTAPSGPPNRLTVSFLDVGQGDATLVQHPDGTAVLFDGGPAEARVARHLRAAGVTRLSAVVATHASADHHGGLPEVLERFPVGLLLDGGDGSPDPGFRAVMAQADRRRVRRVRAAAGQSWRVGGLRVRVLSPRPRPLGPAPEDPNPRAVVAVVSAGEFDLFLSADAESPSLAPLSLPDVEAMKVPHHGSKDPGLPAVLRELRPQVAVIEVGGDNTYGHPAPETLAALDAAGLKVYRTDRDGTVTLTAEGAGLRVDTQR